MPLIKTSTVLQPEQMVQLRHLSKLWGVSVAHIMREAVSLFLHRYGSKTYVHFADVVAERNETSDAA
jgi:hypothetical protein